MQHHYGTLSWQTCFYPTFAMSLPGFQLVSWCPIKPAHVAAGEFWNVSVQLSLFLQRALGASISAHLKEKKVFSSNPLMIDRSLICAFVEVPGNRSREVRRVPIDTSQQMRSRDAQPTPRGAAGLQLASSRRWVRIAVPAPPGGLDFCKHLG